MAHSPRTPTSKDVTGTKPEQMEEEEEEIAIPKTVGLLRFTFSQVFAIFG